MPTTALDSPTLARLVLATADLHEQSFYLRPRVYRLDLYEAALLACELLDIDPPFSIPTALMLSEHTWNDALVWAGDRKGRKPEVTIPADFVWPSREPVKG